MRLPFVLLIACHAGSPSSTRSPTPAATPEAIAPVEAPVGAVPIPQERVRGAQDLNWVDPTVTLDELPRADAAWQARKTIAYKGRVVIALHASGNRGELNLAIVDTVTETETGYPGSYEDIPIASVDPNTSPEDGNAFTPRDYDEASKEFRGPVFFAIRALPKLDAPEAQRRQYVVYERDRSLLVAEKGLTETTWTPRLRIDAPKSTELIAIDPGWH